MQWWWKYCPTAQCSPPKPPWQSTQTLWPTPINFLSRVKQPVLMLNGRYDYVSFVRTVQEPFFRSLGTLAADRKYIVWMR